MSSSTLRLTRKVRRRELCTRLVGKMQSAPHVKSGKMDAGIPHSPLSREARRWCGIFCDFFSEKLLTNGRNSCNIIQVAAKYRPARNVR